MEADYILHLRDGHQVKLLYLFGTFRKMSRKLNMEYEELMKGCLPVEQGGTAAFLKLNNVPEILLAGAETWCKQNNEPFTYSEGDADLWMDEIDWSQEGILGEIYILFALKLFKMDKSRLEVKPEQGNGEPMEEKKTELTISP